MATKSFLSNIDIQGSGAFSSSVTASSIIKSGGTSAQFLMADGSVSSGGGVAGATATHTQSVAATTWNFAHGTGNPYPVITVWNDVGKVIVPQDITMVDSSNLTITFNVAVAGIATAVVGGVGVGNLTISATPNGLSLTGQELALQLASTTQIGALSSADWNTFNNKAPLASPVFTTQITTPLIVGGTAVGSNIIYKSTTGIGTPTGIAHQWVGGTNGATVLATMLNNGNIGFVGTIQIHKTESSVQDNLLKILSTASTSASDLNWRGRAMFGAQNLTTIMGVYRNQSIIGTHSWTSADNETGAAWGSLYLNWDALGSSGGNVLMKGNVGIGTTSPTAVVNIKAGTATAGTAPLKFTSGTLMTTPEAGAIEFLTDAYYATITTGAARKQLAFTGLAGVKTYYVSDTSGGATTRKLTFTDGILTAEI
jgi:hypothetical protein